MTTKTVETMDSYVAVILANTGQLAKVAVPPGYSTVANRFVEDHRKVMGGDRNQVLRSLAAGLIVSILQQQEASSYILALALSKAFGERGVSVVGTTDGGVMSIMGFNATTHSDAMEYLDGLSQAMAA